MNKEFIPYEQALELKELGFNEPCFARYIKDELKLYHVDTQNSHKESALAPLYQQAFRWFREQVFSQIVVNKKGASVQGMLSLLPLVYLNNYEIKVIKESIYHTLDKFSGAKIPSYEAALSFIGYEVPTYEEAELACLKKLIEIAKNK